MKKPIWFPVFSHRSLHAILAHSLDRWLDAGIAGRHSAEKEWVENQRLFVQKWPIYIYIYTSYMSVDHVHPWVGVKSSEILQYYRFFHEFQQICAMVAWFAELNHAMSWTFMRLLFICWAMPKCQQGDPVVICRMFCSGLNGCSGFTRPCSYGSKVRPVGICWDHHPLDLLKRKPFSSRGFPSVWKLLH